MQQADNQVNEEFLKKILADGPLPAWYIMREVKAERHKHKLAGRTSEDFTRNGIKRAKRRLKIKVRNEQGTITWELPC